MRCRADNRLPWRLTAPLPAERAGVNAVRPVEAAAPHATMQHGANVIQHNAGGLCALSPGGNGGEPDPLRAARVRTIRIMSCAPAFSPVVRAAQSCAGALLCCRRWCRSVAPQSPPSLAAPVLFCGGVIVGQPVVKGCRPDGLRLKGLYARPASSGCGGSCRAKRPRVTRSRLASFRCPPRSGVVMQRQTRSGSGATERRSVACGLSAARTRRPAPWPRHAAGGVLAAPRHGLPETDLVESRMTGSWRW